MMLFIDPRYLWSPDYSLHGHCHPHQWTSDCGLVAPSCVPCDTNARPLSADGDDLDREAATKRAAEGIDPGAADSLTVAIPLKMALELHQFLVDVAATDHANGDEDGAWEALQASRALWEHITPTVEVANWLQSAVDAGEDTSAALALEEAEDF